VSTPPDPRRPRLVLRVGFAGRQALSAAEARRLEAVLIEVLETLGQELAASAHRAPWAAGPEPTAPAFRSGEPPVLRLVTGLCQGADAVAADVLARIGPAPGVTRREPGVETELAAVLPFDVASYRSSRPPDFRATFDEQLARCASVMALDGIYEMPEPDTALARSRRDRAYRAQGAYLLRQSDLVVAATDPDAPGKPGGTLETARAAIDADLPVVFIHTGTGSVRVVRSGDDLDAMLAASPPGETEWRDTLRSWTRRVSAGADRGKEAGGACG
jgi:hypothetical protein